MADTEEKSGGFFQRLANSDWAKTNSEAMRRRSEVDMQPYQQIANGLRGLGESFIDTAEKKKSLPTAMGNFMSQAAPAYVDAVKQSNDAFKREATGWGAGNKPPVFEATIPAESITGKPHAQLDPNAVDVQKILDEGKAKKEAKETLLPNVVEGQPPVYMGPTDGSQGGAGDGSPFPPSPYSMDYARKWMDDAFNWLITEGGYGGRGWTNIMDFLGSGDYDAWRDWLSYGDPGVGAQLFWQTYGTRFGDILGNDMSNIWSQDTGWNNELLKAVYDKLMASDIPDYANTWSSGDYAAIRQMLGDDPSILGDDYLDWARKHGVGWHDYDVAKQMSPDLTFQDWYTQNYPYYTADQLKRMMAQSTDYIAKQILYGDDMYGKDATYETWSPFVSDADVYGNRAGWSLDEYDPNEWTVDFWRDETPYYAIVDSNDVSDGSSSSSPKKSTDASKASSDVVTWVGDNLFGGADNLQGFIDNTL